RQLRSDAHPVARMPDASCHEVIGAKVRRDFFLGRWTFLIARYGIPPDHTQRIEATECIDHLVSYALGEVVLAFVAGLVGEGQHRDDGDRAGRGRLRWLGESRNSGWLAQQGEPCTRREKNGGSCRHSHHRAPRPSPSRLKRRRPLPPPPPTHAAPT